MSDVQSMKQAVTNQERLNASARAKTHTLAQLRQMTWEATQYLSYDEVREYVEGVLREVESDAP